MADRKDEILEKLDEYEAKARSLQRNISDIKLEIAADIDAESLMLKFLRTNEALYIEMKKFAYDILGRISGNVYEETGTTDNFPSSLSEVKEGVWRFILPPFYSIQNKKRFAGEGAHIYNLVTNLEMKYEREHGRIEKMYSPVVCFRHHICTETDRIFDTDNIDSKRAIDALQGFFLMRDDALYLRTHHNAIKDPGSSYCEFFVFDTAKTGFEIDGVEYRKDTQNSKKNEIE